MSTYLNRTTNLTHLVYWVNGTKVNLMCLKMYFTLYCSSDFNKFISTWTRCLAHNTQLTTSEWIIGISLSAEVRINEKPGGLPLYFLDLNVHGNHLLNCRFWLSSFEMVPKISDYFPGHVHDAGSLKRLSRKDRVPWFSDMAVHWSHLRALRNMDGWVPLPEILI